MKNMVKIQARAYSVELRDIRTDEIVTDSVILTREQLKAADDTGLTIAGLMTALYDRKGYHVVKIGTPVKRNITIGLCVTNEGEIVQSGVTYFLDGTPVDIKFSRRVEFCVEGKSMIALVPSSYT